MFLYHGMKFWRSAIVLVLFVFHWIHFIFNKCQREYTFHWPWKFWKLRNLSQKSANWGTFSRVKWKFGIYPWWIIHHHYPPFNLKNVMQNVGSPHLKPNHRPFWHFGSFESSLDFELDRTKICPPKPKVLIVRVIRNV